MRNNIKFYKVIILGVNILFSTLSVAQTNENDPLMFGAEIFIEPGQSDKNIESWFKTLNDNNMQLTRIRMFENYMKDSNGNWDFSLFDKAFKYAEKYNIKVYANLFPATDFTDVGGFKFPYDKNHLQRIAQYIKTMVEHFKKYKSLYGWVPINEPGGGSIYDPLAKEIFSEWKNSQKNLVKNSLKDTPHFSFDNNQFLLYYNTWYLKWLTKEIRKYDTENPIHVNTHQIFDNVAQYDFPAWNDFLTSLGGSAHASWHFGYFPREKYALAMSANSEIILSGATKIPWLMTELQGGNNIYSGYAPFCPTKEEVAQWLWISVATGSKGAIFWCLNPRMSGAEAGEWAMVDFQNKPTNRLVEVGKIAKIIQQNEKLFSTAKPVNSPITILYNRESMWVENRMTTDLKDNKFEIRSQGAVIKSAISYFEALSQIGLQPAFKEFNEFSFSEKDYTGQSIILAHQIAIPEAYYDKLRHFVKNGGTLIVDGLTAFYDENAISKMVNYFPLSDLLGGNVSEFVFEKDIFDLKLANKNLSAHALKGIISVESGKSLNDQNENLGIVNSFGKGKVVWVPSLIGLGARKVDNYETLMAFLMPYIDNKNEFSFDTYHRGLLMKNLKSGKKVISVIINKNKTSMQVKLKGFFNRYKNPSILYSNKNSRVSGENVTINSEDTLVILWN
ncbi:beta-galactosidase [Capnocytophaga catalasegens]|uniref:beta-galactosidase n=1 Tax=Capnocytophaga catalasegens TaxID=1004260 RepID=A0AAV5AUX1_9FLAO|nr:beta-galactosidase [Capnocytophaga catalasegens]GIZ15683.1 hypothetical protein RCZ03_16830 [Capnocytophaga catalasegens]GJM50070.1 hypothetical protein RCZ15_10440 [Capnocytophaga catalasegens]GJM53105.1 hypothetical protein RCZ16_14220 [Capnocytophaga catalasegens]